MYTGALCLVKQVDCSNTWLTVSDDSLISKQKRVGTLFPLTVALIALLGVTVSEKSAPTPFYSEINESSETVS